jgi:sugar phosphate isomerase/epimerase
MAGLGYRCAAITLDHCSLNPFGSRLGKELRDVRRLLDLYGLASVVETGARFLLDPWRKHEPTLLSEEEDGRRLRLRFLKQAIDIAAGLGSRAVSFWSGRKSQSVESERAWNWIVSGCRELSFYAGERGVILAFEPEPGMWIENLSQYRALKRDVDHEFFQLTLDLGHTFLTEQGPVGDCIRENIGDIKNIHIEDMKRGIHEHRFFGDGDLDFRDIFRALAEAAYSGLICVELSRHSHDAVAVAQKAKQFLEDHMKYAGISSGNETVRL